MTILLALAGILDLSLVIQLVLSHGSFFDISRRLFLGIIFIIASLGSYHTAKDVGTSEDDDGRDKYVRQKTRSEMYKITSYLLFYIGAGLLAWGMILNCSHGNSNLIYTLVLIGLLLLILWILLFFIEVALTMINYHRD